MVTWDTRLGCLSVHLDTPQCFSAELYSQELNIVDKPEDDKINFARENAERALGSLDEKTKASRGETYGKNIFGQ